MLSHQLESFQHTHRHGLPCCCHRHGHGSGQESCPAGGATSLVCVQPPLCTGDALEGTGEQAVLDPSLADHLLVGQGINNSIHCQVIYPQTTAPPGLLCPGPGSSPFGLFVAGQAEATALSLPLFQSPTATNSSFHWSLFLNWKHKWSIVRNLCDFSPDMTELA